MFTQIFIILFAAFLWGSWLQARKYTGDFPLESFMIWLYGASAVLVYVVIGITQIFTKDHVLSYIENEEKLAAFVMLCGACMAIGMQLQMKVVDRVGLILSNSVSATCGVLLGTAVTALVGGLPESVSLGSVFLSAFILICATMVCQHSGRMRDRDLQRKSKKALSTQDNKAAALLVLSSVLVAFYPLGMSLGVATDYSVGGFPTLTCIWLLATGSFVGTVLYSAFSLTKNKQWGTLVNPKYKKAIGISCLCGVCHYGGNLLHVLSSPVMSVAVSWLLGRTANMWTYLWGIYHKEYKGSSGKTYMMLAGGIGIYLLGVVILSISLYT